MTCGMETTLLSMAECAVMAATRRCHQERSGLEIDEVMAVLVYVLGGVRVSWLLNFFLVTRVRMLMEKNSDSCLTSMQGIITYNT